MVDSAYNKCNMSNIAVIIVKNLDYFCMKKLIYQKTLCLKIVDIYKKYCLFKTVFYTFFSCSIYKIVDPEYRIYIYKSVKINIGTVMKNGRMLQFTPDYLKTKTMWKNAVKKLLFLIRYIPDNYKIQQMCDKAVLENGGTLSLFLTATKFNNYGISVLTIILML